MPQFDPLASVKDGLEKAGELLTFTEPVQQAPDPTALSTKAKPSPRLYVAMARLSEESRQLTVAEDYYKKALSMDPIYLDALLGLGRLNDREGKLEEALSCYQKATKAHPNEAAAWNHLGLCYARMNRLQDAKAAIEKASRLAPKEPRYRHNLATILVRSGDLQGALNQLQAVHDEATACYNLGYLLAKKGDRTAAVRYFGRALQLKPDFQEARQWLDVLSSQQGIEPSGLVPALSGQPASLPDSVVSQGPGQNPPVGELRSPPIAAGPVSADPQGLLVTGQVAPLPPVLEEESVQISETRQRPMPCPLPPVLD
ncbi:MAG: tetratricopeptide repeat protein [Thermogutta sp.]